MQSEKQNLKRRSVARVLISVSDKSAIDAFSRSLVKNGIEIVSTGGTSKILSENGIAVTPVEDVTKFPEIMDGRVKTLHPLIFGGILARDSDRSETEQYNMQLLRVLTWMLCSKRLISEGPVCFGPQLKIMQESQLLPILQITIGFPRKLRPEALTWNNAVN
jgi:hypothetical protein